MAKGSELVVVKGLKKYQETDAAILVGPPGLKPYAPYDDGKVWVPLGIINHTTERKDSLIDIEVPQWFAERKDLQYGN